MSCSLPQSEASGRATLSRSRRLTEVGTTRGCLFGSSHLFHQFTHRHDELANSFFGGNDFFAGKAWRGPTSGRPDLTLSLFPRYDDQRTNKGKTVSCRLCSFFQ